MKEKRNLPQESALVFTTLLVFTPVIVWAHGCTLDINDAIRIVMVPVLWLFIPNLVSWTVRKGKALLSRLRKKAKIR